MTALVLRRTNVSRISGQWQDDDFDVFDGERDVECNQHPKTKPQAGTAWGNTDEAC